MHKLKVPTTAGVLSIFFLAVFTFLTAPTGAGNSGLLRVTFLDVGQGDATFIESPSGTQVLIDGGKGGGVLRELGAVMGFFDRSIDMVVATHPDLDHIGGLIGVFERYDVKTVLMTENLGDTPAFDALLTALEGEGAEVIYARKGQVFAVGSGSAGSTTIRILFPDRDPTYLESNSSSIVAQLVYGETEFMLTGDSPQEIEEYLVGTGSVPESDVLKVGHHGSRTSTSEAFLNAVNPKYAIISAGKDNSYGHPHKEVTDLLTRHGVTQKNTADGGSIFSVSDGTRIWFK
jgi:competence protein ComEC